MSSPTPQPRASLRLATWLIPSVTAVLLAVAGWWIQGTVEDAMRNQLAEELVTILRADVAALDLWAQNQRSALEIIAGEPEMRDAVSRLVGGDELDRDSWQQIRTYLSTYLAPRFRAHGWLDFAILATDGRAVAASIEGLVGRRPLENRSRDLARVFTGEVLIIPPFFSELRETQSQSGPLRPTMLVLAPVRGDGGAVIGALVSTLPPELDFTRILSLARSGESGETLAFDARGVLLSQSRFDDELRRAGLLPDDRTATSVLALELRDPGGNLLRGYRPRGKRSDLPLTKMVADAASSRRAEVASYESFDVDGYRDYRGVNVVGAWTWLHEYDFGVATKVDVAEAYRALHLLRRAFVLLFVLLATVAVAVFIFTGVFTALRQRAAAAAIEARQLGQYTLQEMVGSGGMGEVYRATHALLRRPTAVKLLRTDRNSPADIARFEREVQLTCRLTHPNTIDIFDYGHTPEGVFYYAMELLRGASLQEVIDHTGTMSPERTIHVLRQACGSLREAHGIGFIHRDVKPGNIFLTQRGGVQDVVKVLDFGLVREIDSAKALRLTGADIVAGTPAYMAPEAIQNPDAVSVASDVYALGAVAYVLLTGHTVFEGDTPMAVYLQQVNEAPIPLSVRAGRPIDPALEALVLRCLAKEPGERPPDMDAIVDALSRCAAADLWTQHHADAWWAQFGDLLAERRLEQARTNPRVTLNVNVGERLVARARGNA